MKLAQVCLPNDLEYRLGTEDDLSEIAELYKYAEESIASKNISMWKNYWKRYEEMICESIVNDRYHVLDGAEIQSGMVVLLEDLNMWGETEDTAFIKSFASKVKGAGAILLDCVEKTCRENKIKTLSVDVLNSNERLKQYYIANGFSEIGIAETRYKTGGKACKMSKGL